MSTPSYYDLERSPGDLSGYSLEEILIISKSLDTSMCYLLGIEGDLLDSNIKPDELFQLIQRHCDKTGTSIQQLESEIGWEIADLKESPTVKCVQRCLDWLVDVANAVDVDWRRVIPALENYPTRKRIADST